MADGGFPLAASLSFAARLWVTAELLSHCPTHHLLGLSLVFAFFDEAVTSSGFAGVVCNKHSIYKRSFLL